MKHSPKSRQCLDLASHISDLGQLRGGVVGCCSLATTVLCLPPRPYPRSLYGSRRVIKLGSTRLEATLAATPPQTCLPVCMQCCFLRHRISHRWLSELLSSAVQWAIRRRALGVDGEDSSVNSSVHPSVDKMTCSVPSDLPKVC